MGSIAYRASENEDAGITDLSSWILYFLAYPQKRQWNIGIGNTSEATLNPSLASRNVSSKSLSVPVTVDEDCYFLGDGEKKYTSRYKTSPL